MLEGFFLKALLEFLRLNLLWIYDGFIKKQKSNGCEGL